MRKLLSLMLLACLVSLGACSHKPPKDTGTAAAATQVPATGAQTNGAAGNSALGAGAGAVTGTDDVAGPQEGILAQRNIYFAFDSSELSPEGTTLIAAHAHYLIGHSNLHVRLEGNTDERGSREYNIGLGERRAQAVRRAMLLQGVAETQLSTVSYGAERPAVEGHDEAAWSKNRRVTINYVQ